MEALGLLNIVLRRWWLLVLGAAIGCAVAALAVSEPPPRYESMVTLQLKPSTQSTFMNYFTDVNSVTSLAAYYRELLRTQAFSQLAVERLGLPVAPEAVTAAITTKHVPQTNIFQLTVTWDNALDAQDLAQALAELFIAENSERQSDDPALQARLYELEESARTASARMRHLRQQREQYEQRQGRGDFTRLGELIQMDSNLTSLESSYATLLVEINQLRSTFDRATILDNATPARRLQDLRRTRFALLGMLMGLLAAAGLAYLIERLQDRLRTPEDVTSLSGRAPLASIGKIKPEIVQPTLLRPQLVVVHNPISPEANAFQSLRANILFAAQEQPLGALLVTSPSPGDGKTVVSANLAVAMGQFGKRVLLVDTDLRRPSLHRMFGIENRHGLTDMLAAEERLYGPEPASPAGAPPGSESQALVHPHETCIVPSGAPNVWVLPTGRLPANPSLVLGSIAATSLFGRLRRFWDVVIFDSAPAGLAAETVLIASQVDGTLVVARSGKVNRGALLESLEALGRTGKPIVGLVLNDFQPSRLLGYRYYGYGYYTKPVVDVANELAGGAAQN